MTEHAPVDFSKYADGINDHVSMADVDRARRSLPILTRFKLWWWCVAFGVRRLSPSHSSTTTRRRREDPVTFLDILKAAGVECREVSDWVGIYRCATNTPAYAIKHADIAILALARLVAHWKYEADMRAEDADVCKGQRDKYKWQRDKAAHVAASCLPSAILQCLRTDSNWYEATPEEDAKFLNGLETKWKEHRAELDA